jgi:hypothetical protein
MFVFYVVDAKIQQTDNGCGDLLVASVETAQLA